MMLTVEQVAACGAVPVVVLDDASLAVRTARALLDGGINAMEITFRTEAAREAIALVAEGVPEMIVGAGTVVNVEQLHEAVDAGAQFIVCPGTDEAIIAEATMMGVPIMPGVVTPSEIMVGLKYGIRVFKFVPAGCFGGLRTIKALCGPFPQIKFIPTGGVNQDNAADFFENRKILAVGGSWMAPRSLIADGDFEEITELSRAITDLYREIRMA